VRPKRARADPTTPLSPARPNASPAHRVAFKFEMRPKRKHQPQPRPNLKRALGEWTLVLHFIQADVHTYRLML
jgi:hypothetical protein